MALKAAFRVFANSLILFQGNIQPPQRSRRAQEPHDLFREQNDRGLPYVDFWDR